MKMEYKELNGKSYYQSRKGHIVLNRLIKGQKIKKEAIMIQVIGLMVALYITNKDVPSDY